MILYAGANRRREGNQADSFGKLGERANHRGGHRNRVLLLGFHGARNADRCGADGLLPRSCGEFPRGVARTARAGRAARCSRDNLHDAGHCLDAHSPN